MLREHRPACLVLDVDAIPSVGRGFVAHQLKTRYHIPVVTNGTRTALQQIEQNGIPPGVPKPINVGLVMSRVASIVGRET